MVDVHDCNHCLVIISVVSAEIAAMHQTSVVYGTIAVAAFDRMHAVPKLPKKQSYKHRQRQPSTNTLLSVALVR